MGKRRNMRAAIKKAATPAKAAAKKKKKSASAKRPKAALSKGYFEILVKIEAHCIDQKTKLHELRLAVESLQHEVAARDAKPPEATGTNDEAGD